MSSSSGGPGSREVAYRLFATEFEDSTREYSESDEERAPNYVVTPTGARVNRLFVVGVLTETERVGGEQIRGRVVDPTGAFVAYAGQYQPDELAFLDRVEPPAFLAITGKARTFSPEDSDRVYTSVRPESISEVDAATRDRWVVQTAEQTLDRVATMASALRSGLHGEALRERLVEEGIEAGLASGVALAVEHYGTTSAYLRALRETALDAVRVVAGERDEVERLALAPDEGGTDDAVLAGLADMDLGTTGPGLAAADSAVTSAGIGTDESRESPEPAESAEATTTEADTTPEPAEPTSTEATTMESASEPKPTEPESTEPESTGTTGEPAETAAADADAEPEPTAPATEPHASTTEGESESSQAGPVDDGGAEEAPAEPDEEFEDFEPGEFDLPEEEREQIESEFGTEFETAGEVGPAGEADIETPEPDPAPEPVEESASPEPTTETAGEEPVPEPEPAVEPEPEREADQAEADPAEADEDAGDVDVDEVTVEVIAELDDGDGADREAVVSTVAERHGIDPEAVSEAIEAAMMSGRAYEPSDDRLKAI